MALKYVHEVCFSEEAIQEIVQNLAKLYQVQQSNSGVEKKNIEDRMKSLETSTNNWIEALGKGIKGLEIKIIDAQSRLEALQYELHKINSLDQTTCISDELIRSIITNKKHLLYSADEADKKQVLQEYVDHVVIQSCNDIDLFNAEITYRVLSGGGEGSRTPVLIIELDSNQGSTY
jgi:site-specific DNA recombinase